MSVVVRLPTREDPKGQFLVDTNNNFYFSRPLGSNYVCMNVDEEIPNCALTDSIPKEARVIRSVPTLVERLGMIPFDRTPLIVIGGDNDKKIMEVFTNVEVTSSKVKGDITDYTLYETPDFSQFSLTKSLELDLNESILNFLRNEYFDTDHTLEFAHGRQDIRKLLFRHRNLISKLEAYEQSELRDFT